MENESTKWLDGVDVWFDGSKLWYVGGRLHRIDGPAIEWASGAKHWFKNGKCHRDDDEPAIVGFGGETKVWVVKGTTHRDFGLPSTMGDNLGWSWFGCDLTKEKSFEMAIFSRNKKFGLFAMLSLCLEDDLYFLIRVGWKSLPI